MKIKGLENNSYKEIKKFILDFILCETEDLNLNIIELKLNGSRVNGTPREYSDLDAILIYDNNIKEYHLFNILHSEPLYIDEILVDINPIRL